MDAKTCEDTSGNSALHLAVINNKGCDEIKEIIDAGADVNQPNFDGNTALHLCLLNTERFSLMTFDPLADEKASEKNFQPLQSHTITLNADLLEDYDIAETLIDEGADLNIQNKNGNTPLHLALIHSKASNHVQEINDRREYLNKQCAECVKMFNLASQQSNMYKLVKKIIDKGADVGKQNNEGNTALHLALSSQLQLVDTVYEMFERQVKSYIDLLEINDENESIRYHDNFEKLLDLLLKESETMYIRNRLDMDPVWMAIDFIKGKHGRYQQIFSLLMTFGPLLTLEYHQHFTYSDCYGNTLPPHYKIFAAYLTQSFNNACNVDRNTALHLAVMESKDLRQIKTLIDNGDEINKQNSRGNTALHLCLLNTGRFSLMTFDPLADERASEKNVQPLQSHTITLNANLLEDYDIAETLIDEGADLNIQNNDGNTPLHLALIHSKASNHVQEINDRREYLNKQCAECVKMFNLASQQSNVYKLVKKMIDKGADVGKQNNEGNTALHLALSSQLQLADAVFEMFESYVGSHDYLIKYNFHIRSTPYLKIVGDNFEMLLQILSENSETINITNRLGIDPIQMTIDSISLQEYLMTIVPLFNLEYHKHFSYRDCHGNTLLHLLMESFQNRYYPFITLRSVDPTYLKFNVQNKAGNTPLHIARVEELVYILSYCDKVDLFARNKRKETFLHKIFKFEDLHDWYNDIKQILQGQCKYCSKVDVKKLLCCRDIAGNTPLHNFLTNDETEILSDLIKLFYEAGSDLNACNTSEESILHYLVRGLDRAYYDEESIKFYHEERKKESIKFAIEHGADLNVQNVFGESPIFVAKERDFVRFLIDSGADLNICNKSGQNLLLSRMYNEFLFLEVFDDYLIQNFSLKVKDIHGNNILHCVAWHGINWEGEKYYDDVTLLLDAGAEIEPDALGQLPCYIAHQMGHIKLARQLCKCENTEHLDKFTFTKQILDLYNYISLKSRKHKYFESHPITDILDEPFIGSVRFEGEAEEIRTCIVNIIKEICKRLGHGNDLLENKVIQSGSVGENTKVGLPDEFDFLCGLDILSEACYVETVSKEYPAYATVKLKDEFRGHRCRVLFDDNCFFSCDTVFGVFMAELRDVVQCLDIYSHPNIIYKDIIDKVQRPNVELHFVWTGRKYKGMEIKVDLVPAIQIKGWWPPGTRLDSLACDTEQIEQLRKDGAVILLNRNEYGLPVSVSIAEKMHLAGLPQEARIAYKVAKTLCEQRVCPRDVLFTNITSYMLKNCMFHVLENPIESVYDCVCKIFRYLIECTHNKRLLPYVYPHCNIFEGKSLEKIISMRFYSQPILNMIGSPEQFLPTGIDELIDEYESIYSSNSDLEEHNSDFDELIDEYENTEYN